MPSTENIKRRSRKGRAFSQINTVGDLRLFNLLSPGASQKSFWFVRAECLVGLYGLMVGGVKDVVLLVSEEGLVLTLLAIVGAENLDVVI